MQDRPYRCTYRVKIADTIDGTEKTFNVDAIAPAKTNMPGYYMVVYALEQMTMSGALINKEIISITLYEKP